MPYLTTTQAAERCAVSPRTMLRWLESGRVQATRTAGGHWRIPPDALRHLQPRDRSDGRGPTFAIIEDDPRQAHALRRLLQTLVPAARVEVAHDGLAAGLLLGRCRPDVAFVDIEMPGLDGFDVIRRASRVPELRDTRFVVVSGRLDDERRAVLETLPVWAVVAKPMRVERLAELVGDRVDPLEGACGR